MWIQHNPFSRNFPKFRFRDLHWLYSNFEFPSKFPSLETPKLGLRNLNTSTPESIPRNIGGHLKRT